MRADFVHGSASEFLSHFEGIGPSKALYSPFFGRMKMLVRHCTGCLFNNLNSTFHLVLICPPSVDLFTPIPGIPSASLEPLPKIPISSLHSHHSHLL